MPISVSHWHLGIKLCVCITKWSHYLLGRHFNVRTDQKALKHFLEQSIHTDFQVAGISKLMTFDFTIEFKKGTDNKAAHALSRNQSAELLAISLLTSNDILLERNSLAWTSDAECKLLFLSCK